MVVSSVFKRPHPTSNIVQTKTMIPGFGLLKLLSSWSTSITMLTDMNSQALVCAELVGDNLLFAIYQIHSDSVFDPSAGVICHCRTTH